MNQGNEIFGSIFERGYVIFGQGDFGDSMFVIQEGAVEISQTRGGREEVIGLLKRGDFFGEMALVGDRSRTATARAIRRTRLLPLGKESLTHRLRRDPEMAVFLMKALISKIANCGARLREILETDEDINESVRQVQLVNLEEQSASSKRSSEPYGLDPEPALSFSELWGIREEGQVRYEPWTFIFKEGEPGDRMYFILEGSVEIVQGRDDYTLARFGPYEFFGEMAIITGEPRTATAVTTAPTLLLSLTRAQFLESIRKSPELGLYMVQSLILRLRNRDAALADPLDAVQTLSEGLAPRISKRSAPKIGLISLSTCGGCSATFLEDEAVLSGLLQEVDIVYCPMLIDQEALEEVDIVLIEGTVRVEEDLEKLREARSKSKTLVAWGSCAVFGGIPSMANHFELEDLLESSYGDTHDPFSYYLSGVNNLSSSAYQEQNLALLRRAGSLSDSVKVDYYLPGCPPRPVYFKMLLEEMKGNLTEVKIASSVCGECRRKIGKKPLSDLKLVVTKGQVNHYCLVSEGFFCTGFLTRGGCGALCTRNGTPCWGCRGISNRAKRKLVEGESIEQILVSGLSQRCGLGEDQIRSMTKRLRKEGCSLLSFESSFPQNLSSAR